MSDYLVLGVRSYDFVNDNGERLQGVKVTYLDTPEETSSSKGFTPMTLTAPVELWDSFSNLPAIYNFNLGFKATRAGAKPTVFLNSVKFVKDIKIPS